MNQLLHGSIRWQVVLLFAGISSASLSSTMNGQSGSGHWGVEGRIGYGQSGHLLYWLSPSWSLVAGGSYARSRGDGSPDISRNNISDTDVSLSVRKDIGSGRVRPFLALGVGAGHSRNETIPPPASGFEQSIATTRSIGGRLDGGAFVSVSENLGLGLIVSAQQRRMTAKSRPSNSGAESKSSGDYFLAGTPQLAMRVRF